MATMKNLIFSLIFTIIGLGFVAGEASAQAGTTSPITGLFEREHTRNKQPIPYPSIREADIIWSKRVWRIIDLREKINLPLYYPLQPSNDRFSLISLLLHGIAYENLPAYSVNDDEFRVRISRDAVNEAMGATTVITEVLNPDTNILEQVEVVRDVRVEEVVQILVQEIWFFDRNYSRMDVRIIGICPIREYVNDAGEVVRRQTFWINFPEARNLFARNEVFNPGNDANRLSFDDVFIKRFFNSFIVQASNVYDRTIQDFAIGIDAMIESQRIRDEIFTFEHDLWEF